MGKYFCQCGEGTDVVETRISYKRIRRRRKCPNGHTLTTVEVPHETPKRLKELAKWFGKQGLDPDVVSYANAQIDEIVLGKVTDDDGDDGEGTSSG